MVLVWGVLVASLLGSVHCAAMCGAFACMAGGPARHPDAREARGGPAFTPSRLSTAFAYNVGRLTSYVSLGLLAGLFGGRLDRAGARIGLTHFAAVIAGLLMVAWALGTIAAQVGVRVPVTLAPEWARRTLGSILVAARDRSQLQRSFLIGLVTTLLPCGWLYTFVVVAAGTGSALVGANVMFVFWMGTLPMLVAIAATSARVLAPVARRLPIATATIVLVLGVLSIVGKLRMPIVNEHAASMHMSSANVR